MKKLIILALTLIFTAGISACNTMEGLGQDVKTAGEKLEESAKRNKTQ